MDPDLALQAIHEAIEKWGASDGVTKHEAAGEAFTFFNDLETWLLSGGFLPQHWAAAQPYDPDAPRPDHDADAFIHVTSGAFKLKIKGRPHGTAPTEVDAQEQLERLLDDMEYWPYVWLMSARGVPKLVDMHCGGYTWWLAQKDADDEFQYRGVEELTPNVIHKMQRSINEQNKVLGWQRQRILRRDKERAMPQGQKCTHTTLIGNKRCTYAAKTQVRGEWVCGQHAARMEAVLHNATAGAP
jgi:hypothetical protein